jgi:RHS repeat-associated protein
MQRAQAASLAVPAPVPPPDPAELSAAVRNAAAAREARGVATADASSAQGDLDLARSLAVQARQLREEAADTCARALDTASDQGIQNDPLWKKPINWVKEHWDDIVEACKVIVTVLSVVVMIVGGPLTWVLVGAAAVVLLDSVIKAAQGKGSWLDVGLNALDMFPGGKLVGAGVDGARMAARHGDDVVRHGDNVVRHGDDAGRRLGDDTADVGKSDARQSIADEAPGPADARPAQSKPATDDPIDVAAGSVFLTQTDVVLPGVLPLVLARTHLSSYRVGRWFGPSWASMLDQRVEVSSDAVHYAAPDGMLLAYPTPPADGGRVLPEHGPRLELARTGDAGYAIRDPELGRTLHFDPVGAVGTSGRVAAGNGTRDRAVAHNHMWGQAVTGDGTQEPTAPAPAAVSAPPTVLPLTAVTDRNGNRFDLTYDADGTLTGVTHSGGYRIRVETVGGLVTALRLLDAGNGTGGVFIARYRYDQDRRLTKVINSSGRALRFSYDDAGRMTRWLDRNGTWYGYTYDEAGRAVQGDGSGGTFAVTLDYDPDNRVTVMTDSLGHTTAYHVDDAMRVVGEVDPLGHATLTEWGRGSEPLARTDALGRITRYEYDDAGKLLAVTRPDGSTSTAEYAEYGGLRLPVRLVGPGGAAWRHGYDERGNLTSVTDPTGATAAYDYDRRGHLTGVTDALGNRRQVETNAAGLPVAVTDPLGATTRYTYDPFGRIGSVTDPLGGVTRFGRTTEGKLAWRTLPDGATDRWAYDPEGNLTAHTDPLGQVTRYEVTHFDVPAAKTGPDGARLSFAYDTELRLVAVTDPRGLVWRYDYDPAGNLARETDFDGRVLAYAYDPAGQLVERTNGAGQVVRFVRDVLGNITEKRSGGGDSDGDSDGHGDGDAESVTTFTYDTAGRVVTTANGDAELTFERDPLGRVLAETCNGRTITSAYDVLGRRVRRRTPSGAQSIWEYDAAGRPAALHTAGRTLTFAHDRAGRETERRLDAGAVLAQTWDANHRLLTQTLTASRSQEPPVAWGYPRLAPPSAGGHDPAAVGPPAGPADPTASLVPAAGASGGVGWPGGPNRSRPAGTPSAGGRLVQRRKYQYRQDGHLTGIDDHLAGHRAYDLDAAGRITAVRGSGSAETYDYDASGNLTQADWVPASPNAAAVHGDGGAAIGAREYTGTLIRRAGKTRYEHDAQGRVVLRQRKRLSVKPLTWRYTWDADDRLVGVTTPDGARWRYRYDPLGRRIAKQRLAADGVTVAEQVDFTWDGSILAEQTHTRFTPAASSTPTSISDSTSTDFAAGDAGTGKVPRELVDPVTGPFVGESGTRGEATIDGVGARTTVWDWKPGSFRPLAQTERAPLRHAPQEWVDENFYAIVTDLVGTPTELVDPDGTLAWRTRTTLWGNPLQPDVGEADCPLRFPGQYDDPETGLYYNYFRYYDPDAARYQSPDPLGLAPSPNPRTYVPNPTRWIDPLGLMDYDGKAGGPRTFTSDDPLVADLANEIERANPGHVVDVNVKLKRPDGSDLTDFDIELQNAVIEVKAGSGKGTGAQVSRIMEATDKPVIVYGPDLGGSVIQEVEKRGGLATRSRSDLTAVIAP